MQSHALSYDLRDRRWDVSTFPVADSPRTLVMAFGAPDLVDDPRAFEELAKAYPRSLVIGCSSAGEIHGTSVRDHSLAVTVTKFEKTELLLASLEVRGAADSFGAGQTLAKKLAAKPGLRGVLVLSEGLNVNGSELIRGLNDVLDESIVVTGGLSGDGANFKRTWVAVGSRVKANVVAAVGFYGDHVTIGHGSKGGWDKFGPERVVTKAVGNVLYELDGKPALALYKEYLGDKAAELPASGLRFPLSLRASTKADKFVVRTLLSVDHAANTLTFAGDIPQGHLAQLMKADFDKLVDGAGTAGAMASETGAPPAGAESLVVAISCVGRRLVLGERIEEEVEAVRDAVRSDKAQITGFYSYGEISPYATGHCDLHNQTMTLTVFSESPTPLPRTARPPATDDTNTELVALPSASTRVAVKAVSYDLDSNTWSGALPQLDSPRTLVLGFGASELADQPQAFVDLVKTYPRSLVIGCSSAGEIHGTSVRDRSLAVTVTRFEKTDLHLASLEVSSAADSFGAGQTLAKKLAAKPGLRGVLVLSEGLNVNGSELIRGINDVLDESIVVTGGLSGDGANFKRTWVAVGSKVKANVVAAVGFYGDHVTIGHGSKGGWDKFGPERVVTKAVGNVLYELDGKPALALYKEYLGDKAAELPASGLRFPLSLRASTKADKFVVRTLLSVDHAANTLTFAGDIPQGHLAQLMKADFDKLVDGAGTAGAMASETGAPPAGAESLVVAISCVGRRLVLGERIEEEVEAVRDAVRSDKAQITGFYSYGEISPYATGHCDLHNQTMTLTVFSESPTPLPRKAGPAPRPAAQAALIGAPRPVPVRPPSAPGAQVASTAPRQRITGQNVAAITVPASGPPVVTGHAVRSLSYDLATRAWSGALPPLDSPTTLVLGFGAADLVDDPRAFEELAKAYPRSLVIGCSSAGEIHGTSVRDRSLAVTVTKFEKTELLLASLEVKSAADSLGAGLMLARKLAAKPGLRGVLVLSEGLNVNGSELIRGLNDVLDESIVVTGGLSGDGANFKRTWVAVGSKVKANVVAAVGFYGDHVTIGHGSKGGWDKFGPERVVTKAVGNVLYELDGKPALQLYKEYLGDKAAELPASGLRFPLSLRASTKDDKFVVRTLLSVDHAANTLTFAGDIPQGHLAQLMKADFDKLVDGAGTAGAMASETGAPPAGAESLVVAISCVGRRLVLGERVEEEVEAVRDAVRSDKAQITGFYSYGEISPYATGHCDLHNQTMTLTVFSESPTPLPRKAAPARPSAAPPPRPPAETRPPAPRAPTPAPASRASVTTMPVMPSTPPPAPPAPPVRSSAVRMVEAAASGPVTVPTGPLLRTQRPAATEVAVETSRVGAVQLVKIHGRITEAFKGDALGRTLSGQVVFDLGDVDRVTSFGVREWLAMLAAADMTDVYFARCSEAIVNQLTVIKKFDGGAQILSMFAPYLCGGCGSQFERLLDCEREADELSRLALAPVTCPQCAQQARFDDDARSYFGFAAAHVGKPQPPAIRAVHDALRVTPEAGSTDEIEKIVEASATRVRVQGKLGSQIRWRRIFDGIDGVLVVDLGATSGTEPAAVAALDQALRTLPAEVTRVEVDGAPMSLVETLLAQTDRRIQVTSAVVAAFCPSCAVNRPATVRVAQYALDRQAGRPHPVLCKRCNGDLELASDATFEKLVAKAPRSAPRGTAPPPIAAAATPAAPAVVEPVATAPVPAPARRGTPWFVVGALVALTAAVGGLGLIVLQGRGAGPAVVAAKPVEVTPVAAPAATPPPAPEAGAGAGSAAVPAGWAAPVDLPPGWVERPIAIEPDAVLVVGHSAPSASPEEALEGARRDATLRLIDQLHEDLAGTPVRAFLDKRVRRDAPGAAEAIASRFARQQGKALSFERVEVATRKLDQGLEVYARYKVTRTAYDALVAQYRATTRFRGLEVAQLFPLLETTLHAEGDLVVLGVDRRSAAELAGLREGDVILSVGGTVTPTVDAFRQVVLSAWADTPARGKLSLATESSGAARTAVMFKPAPTPTP